jgi:hypothetical protein
LQHMRAALADRCAWLCYPLLSTHTQGQVTRWVRTVPDVPTLYCYAKHKRMYFHSSAGLAALLAANPLSRAVEYDTGHWIMLQAKDQLTNEVQAFLKPPSK